MNTFKLPINTVKPKLARQTNPSTLGKRACRPPRLAFVLMAAALLAAGCVTDPEVIAAPLPEIDLTVPDGPLDLYLIRIRGNQGAETQQEAQARVDRDFRLSQELTAICMAEQGFVYRPMTRVTTVTLLEGPARGSREFAERFGFGISHRGALPGSQSSVTSEEIDPNREYVAAMSETELRAWQLALWGDWDTWPADGVADENTVLGCMSSAWDTLNADNNPEFAAIRAEIDIFFTAVTSDPRMTALDQEWSACMHNLSYSGWQSPIHLENSLLEEWLTLFTDFAASLQFNDREIAVAVADVTCREQVDYELRARAINFELQHNFVAANLTELEAWVADVESRRGS